MPTIFTILEVTSGHFAHYANPVKEYPGIHYAQRTPVYPSPHYPSSFHVGSTQPKHTLGFGHLSILAVELLFLQYPGSGPILYPPLQLPLSHGQGLHSPGSFIFTKAYPIDGSHQLHLPTKLKYSPLSHSLSSRKKSNSIDSSLNLSLNNAFSGNFSSMPLVKKANRYL